jgi:hypothetical protein
MELKNKIMGFLILFLVLIVWLSIILTVYKDNKSKEPEKVTQQKAEQQKVAQLKELEAKQEINTRIKQTSSTVKGYINNVINNNLKSSKINNNSIESVAAQKLVKELTVQAIGTIEKGIIQFTNKSTLKVQQKVEQIMKNASPRVRKLVEQLVQDVVLYIQNIIKQLTSDKEIMGLTADAKQIIAELDVEINNVARQVAQELVEQSVLTAENIIREAIEEKNSQNEVPVEAFDFDQYSYL